MHESRATCVAGTRTSPVRYETDEAPVLRGRRVPLFQPVRQGNRAYPVSPIYSAPRSGGAEGGTCGGS